MYAWCQKYNKKPIHVSDKECNSPCYNCASMRVLHELSDYQPSFRKDNDNEEKYQIVNG